MRCWVGDAIAEPLSLPSAANHARLGRCLPPARPDSLAYRIPRYQV